MSTSTVEAMFDTVRSLLSDDDGDVFDNSECFQSYNTAWDEIISMMAADQIPTAQRIWYHVVPANTTVLFPIQAGIADLNALLELDERPAGASVNISAIAAGFGNAIQITTSTPHVLTGTPEVFVSDLVQSDGIPANGRWFATVVDSTNLLLRGSIFTGLYSSGGTITTSSDKFVPMGRIEELPDRTPTERLIQYCWREDAMQFVGATSDVQVRITYLSDGTAPQTGSLIYDGIQQALAHRTAAILAFKHDRGQDDGVRLDTEARGPNGDGHGGFYFTFLQRKVRDLQRLPLRRPVRSPDYLQEIYIPSN